MRSGSTQEVNTAKTAITIAIRSASTPPSTSASAVMSMRPSTGSSPPRTRIVSPRCEARPLTITISTLSVAPQRAAVASARPAPASSPATAIAAPTPARTIGFEKAKATIAIEPK